MPFPSVVLLSAQLPLQQNLISKLILKINILLSIISPTYGPQLRILTKLYLTKKKRKTILRYIADVFI